MENIKNIIIGVLVITTLLFGFLYFYSSIKLGVAIPGVIHYQTESFTQGLYTPKILFGVNGIVTLSGDNAVGNGSTTITAPQICNSAVLVWNPSYVNASATLPSAASIQAQCLQSPGELKILKFVNSSSTAANGIRFAAGAGMVLQYSSGTSATTGLGGLDSAYLYFQATSTNGGIEVNIEQFK